MKTALIVSKVRKKRRFCEKDVATHRTRRRHRPSGCGPDLAMARREYRTCGAEGGADEEDRNGRSPFGLPHTGHPRDLRPLAELGGRVTWSSGRSSLHKETITDSIRTVTIERTTKDPVRPTAHSEPDTIHAVSWA